MKIAIIVASDDKGILEFVGRQKGKLLPSSLRTTGISLAFFRFDPSVCPNVDEYILEKTKGYDCFGVISDASVALDSLLFHGGIFCAKVIFPSHISQLNNFFGRLLATWIANLKFLAGKFSNMGDLKLLLLPKDHFAAPELARLFLVVAKTAVDPAFKEDVEKELLVLRKRSSPNKASRSSKRYLIDDNQVFYELAVEQHAEAMTSTPHQSICSVKKFFRFGLRINVKMHYNASNGRSGKTWSGTYHDCHGCGKNFSNVSHLNVFPSGYVEI